LALSGNTGVYLAHALEHAKLTLKDVQPVATTDSGRAQGLLTRNFHGAVTSPPATQQLVAQGMRVLTGPEITDIPANGLATTLQMLEKEPDLVRAMLESLVDAVIWTRSRADEATTYFGEKFKLPQAIASAAYKQQMQVLRWNPTDQQLESAVKLALAALKLPQRAKVGDAIDLTLYREILRRRGLKD
jgi:ABC-type nitrate/sulfonate/bicarbonate transport system substrate-binding protein